MLGPLHQNQHIFEGPISYLVTIATDSNKACLELCLNNMCINKTAGADEKSPWK